MIIIRCKATIRQNQNQKQTCNTLRLHSKRCRLLPKIYQIVKNRNFHKKNNCLEAFTLVIFLKLLISISCIVSRLKRLVLIYEEQKQVSKYTNIHQPSNLIRKCRSCFPTQQGLMSKFVRSGCCSLKSQKLYVSVKSP